MEFATLSEAVTLVRDKGLIATDLRLWLAVDEFLVVSHSPSGLHINFVLTPRNGVFKALSQVANKMALLCSRDAFKFEKGGRSYVSFQVVAKISLLQFLTTALPSFLECLPPPAFYRLEILQKLGGFTQDRFTVHE